MGCGSAGLKCPPDTQFLGLLIPTSTAKSTDLRPCPRDPSPNFQFFLSVMEHLFQILGMTLYVLGMALIEYLLLSFYRGENWGSERLSNLPDVTQLECCTAKLQTQI